MGVIYRGRKRNLLIKPLTVITVLLSIAVGQSSSNKEEGLRQMKASYVCNFARFVEWPASSFDWPESPLEICIFGKDALESQLERAVQGKTVDGHTLEVEHPRNARQAKNCHVLFISKSEEGQTPQMLHDLAGADVLTVSDIDGFRNLGGMISFVMEGDQLRFEVNLDQTQHARLKVSSRLLGIARMVISSAGDDK